MTLYIIHCQANGKYYVGQTVTKRLPSYLKEKRKHALATTKSNHIYSALRKYPFESFSIEPIMECSTKTELDYRERLWIAALNSRDDSVGMNISPGGEGGWFGLKHSPESIEKMRNHPNRARGFATLELRQEHSRKMTGAGNPLFGKTRVITPEWAAKIGASNTGKRHPEETKEKIRQSKVGKSPSEETRARMGAAQRARFERAKQCQSHEIRKNLPESWR